VFSIRELVRKKMATRVPPCNCRPSGLFPLSDPLNQLPSQDVAAGRPYYPPTYGHCPYACPSYGTEDLRTGDFRPFKSAHVRHSNCDSEYRYGIRSTPYEIGIVLEGTRFHAAQQQPKYRAVGNENCRQRASPLNECNQAWVLKNSFLQNSQK
jgi:hypothetical protein